MPKAKTTGKRIVDIYKTMFEDTYGETFNPNWGQVTSAEKIAPYYEMEDIRNALIYFFDHKGKEFYDFLKNIDTLLYGYAKIDEDTKTLNDLLTSTRELVEKIEAEEFGKS